RLCGSSRPSSPTHHRATAPRSGEAGRVRPSATSPRRCDHPLQSNSRSCNPRLDCGIYGYRDSRIVRKKKGASRLPFGVTRVCHDPIASQPYDVSGHDGLGAMVSNEPDVPMDDAVERAIKAAIESVPRGEWALLDPSEKTRRI